VSFETERHCPRRSLLADVRAEIRLLLGGRARSARVRNSWFDPERWTGASRAEILTRFREELMAAADAVEEGADVTSPLVRAAERFIDEHYAEPVTLDLLASILKRSKRHLALRFRRETGRSVHAYVTLVRLRHALALIRGGEKIEAVSLMVGYRSKKNFYRHFKEFVGMTPLRYKAIIRRLERSRAAAE
jgi:AraC-like DNA-binding protein